MKMYVKMIGAAVLAACACGAYADFGYLHFLVDESGAADPIQFEYARVGVSGQNAFLDLKDSSTSWLVGDGTGYGTAANYASLGGYDSSKYSFFIMLYDMDFNAVGISDSVSYDLLSSYIYHDMAQTGTQSAWTVSSFKGAVPEPTSGMLLALGIGMLMLRRKKVRVLVLAATLSCGLFAEQNDTMITFSSTGPDKYADGTVVKDGECYALVWERNGVAFAGIAADGTVVDSANSEIVLTVLLAQGGKCPTTAFELNAKRMERYADGSFSIYLLDTRNAAGAVMGVNAAGRAVAVNGFGKVADGTTEALATSRTAVTVTTKSSVPADAPKPVIKDMKVVGGHVYLTVSQTVPYLQYRISGGESPDEVSGNAVGEAANGKTGEDIILVAPATGSSGFFKVGRN